MMAMQTGQQAAQQKAIGNGENGAVEGDDPEMKEAIEDCTDVLQELREEIELQVHRAIRKLMTSSTVKSDDDH